MKIIDLTWPATLGLDDDLLINVATCRVALLVRGRNAWHSTWVEHYFRNSAMYSDVASAKRAAENLRAQGNVFYVSEAAALLLTSEHSRVVLCDPVPSNPFGAFTGVEHQFSEGDQGSVVRGLYPGVPLREAVETFAHDSGFWVGPARRRHSLQLGRVDEGTNLADLDDAQRMVSLISRAVGADHPLKWETNAIADKPRSSEGVRAVARAWAELLSDVAEALPEAEVDNPATLRRYREGELRAEPWSVWNTRTTTKAADDRARSIAEVREWLAARDLASKLQERLMHATAAREVAQRDRAKPASTSAGVRKQRERFEHAKAREESLRREFEDADAVRAALWAKIVRD